MKKMDLHQIRSAYLDFFASKGHLIADSYSLVPKNDKSLLLIGAGMAPLKKYYTGEETPPSKRMSTCQKCIRTGDIENVGKTDRHATFFEMLGNFSFGDYFKREAITWAWEFITKHLEFDPERIWATVYLEDDEAYKIWTEEVGLPVERVVKLGKEDNFWELEVGPSGPDSEIFYDRGEKHGCGHPDCKPGCDCDRFIEFWNLVFTQFDKDEEGIYHPLPNPNIDTGMGLERMACIMEDVKTIFDISAIRDIIHKIEEISGIKYGENKKNDISVRVITDHVRAMTFMVSDGILPGNEGRGYVLRRIIRRAARHGKLLGIEGAFLSEVVSRVIDSWKVRYIELERNREEILRVIRAEEAKFQETIHQGLQILESYIAELTEKKTTVLDGKSAFKLYDTYGFPLDLTIEILEEKGLSVNREEFETQMENQRKQAREARNNMDSGWETSKANDEVLDGKETEFCGYTEECADSEIILLMKDGQEASVLSEGDKGMVLLHRTPFYGESGGQVGDSGELKTEMSLLSVFDTKIQKGHPLHYVEVKNGSIRVGDSVRASIDVLRRNAIRKNHSATHLLHRVLKDVLGEHVHQAGSVVSPDRLRFDFTHYEAITEEQLAQIESIVNQKILEALPVQTIETTLKKANEMGVIGLFEDKYKENVRVLDMGGYSKELCGGTHVSNTAQIGIFKIISESSIASGVRRIEAITGEGVYRYLLELERERSEVAKVLKSGKDGVLVRVQHLAEELKLKEKELEKLNARLAGSVSDEILKKVTETSGVKWVTEIVDGMDMAGLRTLGDELKSKIGSGVVILASVKDDKPAFIGMATKDLIAKGVHVGNIIKEIAQMTGGGGGGRPDMAQAGGKDASKLKSAMDKARSLLEEQLNK